MACFIGSFLFLLPMFLVRDITVIALSLGAAFFCAELVIGPIWSIPMRWSAPRISVIEHARGVCESMTTDARQSWVPLRCLTST